MRKTRAHIPTNTARADIYQTVTDTIVTELELGLRPWRRPWRTTGAGLPLRHSGQPYRGINALVLWMAMTARGYTSPCFMTYRQASELGGQVRRGERATSVTYADTLRRVEMTEDGEETERSIRVLKSYPVFNANQIDGLPARFHSISDPAAAASPERIAGAEAFFANTGADIRPGGQSAFYTPVLDYVRMPAIEVFFTPEAYYATLAHETGHWTGRPSRLNREAITQRYDGEVRAVEEILAELTAAFTAPRLASTTTCDGTAPPTSVAGADGWGATSVSSSPPQPMPSVPATSRGACTRLRCRTRLTHRRSGREPGSPTPAAGGHQTSFRHEWSSLSRCWRWAQRFGCCRAPGAR